jgi:hypothetical protein
MMFEGRKKAVVTPPLQKRYGADPNLHCIHGGLSFTALSQAPASGHGHSGDIESSLNSTNATAIIVQPGRALHASPGA